MAKAMTILLTVIARLEVQHMVIAEVITYVSKVF
jgi:hypothetical protein